jgi:hypothetical protein
MKVYTLSLNALTPQGLTATDVAADIAAGLEESLEVTRVEGSSLGIGGEYTQVTIKVRATDIETVTLAFKAAVNGSPAHRGADTLKVSSSSEGVIRL